jgi:hypothetical protein
MGQGQFGQGSEIPVRVIKFTRVVLQSIICRLAKRAMKIHHVYKRSSFDKTTNGFDDFTAGEWHYCGTWTDESLARERADSLVEEGSSVRLLTSDLNTLTEIVIEFGVPIYQEVAQLKAEQELQSMSYRENTSPLTQSPDSSPSKSRHATFDFNTEDCFKFSSWV